MYLIVLTWIISFEKFTVNFNFTCGPYPPYYCGFGLPIPICPHISTMVIVPWLTLHSKIQQTKKLATCQRFGDLFLFGLVWQYSSVQTKYNKGRFKVMITYLQQ